MTKTSSNKNNYADKTLRDIDRNKEFMRINREQIRIKSEFKQRKK